MRTEQAIAALERKMPGGPPPFVEGPFAGGGKV